MASMGSAQPSGAVTLVFTDIEGSTRLLTELGEERYRAALDLHRRQVRACGRQNPRFRLQARYFLDGDPSLGTPTLILQVLVGSP